MNQPALASTNGFDNLHLYCSVTLLSLFILAGGVFQETIYTQSPIRFCFGKLKLRQVRPLSPLYQKQRNGRGKMLPRVLQLESEGDWFEFGLAAEPVFLTITPAE